MAARPPIADDIIAVVQVLIANLGANAFKTDGRVQLYSGPHAIISTALGLLSNHSRAFAQAARLLTTMIDHTDIGQRLDKYEDDQNIYQFFEKHYGTKNKLAFQEADKVMRFASSEFVKSAFGHVATAVCGAATDRVFFEVELPELVANARIETINDIDMERVRDVYHTKGAYAAFRKICQAEIVMAYKHAKSENTKAAWDDYSERRQLFMMERKLTIEAHAKALRTAAAHMSAIHSSLTHGSPTVPTATPLPTKTAHKL